MATPEDARRANRSLLLRTLHRDGPLSRADLAKVTGLTRATVSAVVRDLMDDAVVEELGLSTAGGVGKPATLVDVAADGRHVLCLDLSEPARFVGAIVNLAGKVVVRRTYDRKDRTGRSAVTLVRRICRELVADAERPLLGIGVASPGIVDAAGVVVTAAHLGWTGVPLGADAGDRVRAARRRRQRRQRRRPRRADVRRRDGRQPDLRPRRRGRRRRARARRSPLRRLDVRRRRDRPRRRRARRRPSARAASAAAWRPRSRRRCSPAGWRPTPATARPSCSAPASTSAPRWPPSSAPLDVADVVLSGSGAVATETFRTAAAGAIAARTMPVLGDRLVVRASTFGFDDVARRRGGPGARPGARHPMNVLPPPVSTPLGTASTPATALRPASRTTHQPRPRRTPVNRTRTVRTLAVLATASLLVAACGGDDDDDAADTEATSAGDRRAGARTAPTRRRAATARRSGCG